MTNSEKRIITAYNNLDEYIRKALNPPTDRPHSELLSEMVSEGYISNKIIQNLHQFAKIRNIIIHNPKTKLWVPFIEPHPHAVTYYEEIVKKIVTPPTVETIQIPTHKIYSASLNSDIVEVMLTMGERGYSIVPILENFVVVGVFSESTPLAVVAKEGEFLIAKDTLLSDFEPFLGVERQINEYFSFTSRTTLVSEVAGLFAKSLGEDKRLAAVFVTENGKESEKLLGLVTAWDVAGADLL